MGLRDWLMLPEARGASDLDDPGTTVLHGQIIRNKPFLRRLYVDCYEALARALPQPSAARVLELGSGGGFIKEVIPQAITSDVLHVPGLDVVTSALQLPFADGGLDAIVMINVLHHLPDVGQFFTESTRCLRPGGKIVMIEPANTLWARFVYRHFHHEPFEPAADWPLPRGGPMSMANGALPWIVFSRDRARFEKRFPQLAVRQFRALWPVRYLVSGGVSMRSLLPSVAYPLVKAGEAIVSPLNSALGMFYFVELERR